MTKPKAGKGYRFLISLKERIQPTDEYRPVNIVGAFGKWTKCKDELRGIYTSGCGWIVRRRIASKPKMGRTKEVIVWVNVYASNVWNGGTTFPTKRDADECNKQRGNLRRLGNRAHKLVIPIKEKE